MPKKSNKKNKKKEELPSFLLNLSSHVLERKVNRKRKGAFPECKQFHGNLHPVFLGSFPRPQYSTVSEEKLNLDLFLSEHELTPKPSKRQSFHYAKKRKKEVEDSYPHRSSGVRKAFVPDVKVFIADLGETTSEIESDTWREIPFCRVKSAIYESSELEVENITLSDIKEKKRALLSHEQRMHKNRKQRSVAIQSTDFVDPEFEARAQPARLCKKAGFRNLLQKSVTLVSQNNVERGGSFTFLEKQRSKSVQATLDDRYALQKRKYRSPSLETISIHKRYLHETEDNSRRTTSEMVNLFDNLSNTKPGTSRIASTAFNSITEVSDICIRPNEGSLAVIYNSREKGTEGSKSSNIFFFGSQGSRRFSDETVILIQDYQSYDLINAAGRQEVDLFRENVPTCCGKSKQTSVELATRPIPIDFGDADENTEVVCRICHEGEEVELLIQPCLCKGSVGYLHASCLKSWLEQSSTSRCELCNYPYAIIQTRKYSKHYSVKVFFKTVVDRRAMAYDIISFVIITPLTLVGVAMCIQASLFSSIGSTVDSGFQMGNITKAGLIMLSVTIIVAYAIWLYTLIAFHYKAWKKWYNNCYNVEVLPVKMTSEERLEAARRLSEEMNRRQLSREQGSTVLPYLRSSQNVNFNQGLVPVRPVS